MDKYEQIKRGLEEDINEDKNLDELLGLEKVLKNILHLEEVRDRLNELINKKSDDIGIGLNKVLPNERFKSEYYTIYSEFYAGYLLEELGVETINNENSFNILFPEENRSIKNRYEAFKRAINHVFNTNLTDLLLQIRINEEKKEEGRMPEYLRNVIDKKKNRKLYEIVDHLYSIKESNNNNYELKFFRNYFSLMAIFNKIFDNNIDKETREGITGNLISLTVGLRMGLLNLMEEDGSKIVNLESKIIPSLGKVGLELNKREGERKEDTTRRKSIIKNAIILSLAGMYALCDKKGKHNVGGSLIRYYNPGGIEGDVSKATWEALLNGKLNIDTKELYTFLGIPVVNTEEKLKIYEPKYDQQTSYPYL